MGERWNNIASATVGLIVGGAVLLAPGCGMFGGGGGDPVVVAETEDGEQITWDELDALTRAFADRQVGLLYSITQSLAHDDASVEQRRAARTLLADGATNLYNIASDENVFNRVLDFAVVTALLHRQWGGQGRAGEVFGEDSERLVDALADMAADARDLASRVLDDEQLGTLDRLVESWHDRNPQVHEVSFVRFAQFASGETRPDAQGLLGVAGMLFAEIGAAGEAVDSVARVADRAMYRAERAGTLLRWQVAAAKADAVATPEINDALDQIKALGDRLDALPGALGDEAESVLASLDERLPALNEAMENARAVIQEADALAASVGSAGTAVEGAVRASSSLMESGVGEGGSMDVAEYGQVATSIGDAALRIERAAESIGTLLGSSGSLQGEDGLAKTVDGRIGTATDAADELIKTAFWRLAALLGILFVLLLGYRAISFWIVRHSGPARSPATRPRAAREG